MQEVLGSNHRLGRVSPFEAFGGISTLHNRSCNAMQSHIISHYPNLVYTTIQGC